jgi:hypothetical protein
VQDLERDQAAQHHVARQEDVGLPAGAEPPLDDVVADADDAVRAARLARSRCSSSPAPAARRSSHC